MLEHIVAATDLSASSIDAVERGFLITQATGADYTVLHAAGLDALASVKELLGGNIEAVRRKIAEDATARLQEIVAESSFAQNIAADMRVEEGRATTAIPAFVAKSGAGLLLIGAHGHGFLHRILLGSTASILLRECKCPVLVVKQPPRHAYKRVLVAVDFSPASVAAIATAREAAPGAAMTLLHVFDLPFEGMMFYAGVDEAQVERYAKEARESASAQLRALARSMDLEEAQCIVARGDATRRIASHQEMLRSDLVVLGKHGANITEELLLGSVTSHLVAESQSDLLVVVDARRPNEET